MCTLKLFAPAEVTIVLEFANGRDPIRIQTTASFACYQLCTTPCDTIQRAQNLLDGFITTHPIGVVGPKVDQNYPGLIHPSRMHRPLTKNTLIQPSIAQEQHRNFLIYSTSAHHRTRAVKDTKSPIPKCIPTLPRYIHTFPHPRRLWSQGDRSNVIALFKLK
jgi:hypothetical protein